jgi:PD-(D/E)XK nuclease superfamily
MNTDKNLRLPTHPAAPVSALAAVPTIKEYPEQELTGAILQAAFAVHNTLGAGFLERVYSSALAIELDGKGPKLVPNDQLQVKYRGSVAGDSIADMIVGCLRATHIRVELLLNFGRPKLEYRTFVC